jgi:hypothetical protein
MQDFGAKYLNERHNLEDLQKNEGIILKWILKNYNMYVDCIQLA